MLKPLVPRSTMKAVTPSWRLPSPVRAMTMTKSACGTRLTQIFLPLITQSSPSFAARVIMPAGSPPAPGSEIAIAECASPRA